MKQALPVKAEDVPSAPFLVLRYEGDRQLSGIDRPEQREVRVPPLPLTYSEPQYLRLLSRLEGAVAAAPSFVLPPEGYGGARVRLALRRRWKGLGGRQGLGSRAWPQHGSPSRDREGGRSPSLLQLCTEQTANS